MRDIYEKPERIQLLANFHDDNDDDQNQFCQTVVEYKRRISLIKKPNPFIISDGDPLLRNAKLQSVPLT